MERKEGRRRWKKGVDNVVIIVVVVVIVIWEKVL